MLLLFAISALTLYMSYNYVMRKLLQVLHGMIALYYFLSMTGMFIRKYLTMNVLALSALGLTRDVII